MKKLLAFLLLCFCISLSAYASEAVSPCVFADGAHALAIDSEGRVWAWGSNHLGESDPAACENSVLTPAVVFENAVSAACGQQFSMALSKDGALYAWGNSPAPERGAQAESAFVRIAENICGIDACDNIAAAVSTDGTLYAWENGEESILSENAVKCAVGLDYIVELDDTGCVYEHTGGEKTPILQNCADIDASGESRYAISLDGTLYAWGVNASDGRLGLGGGAEIITSPVQIDVKNADKARAGLSASGCITKNGDLYVWGSIYSYLTALSDEGEIIASLVDGALITYGSTPLALYENVADAAFGDAFVCILFESGEVFTWGTNDHGQLGNGVRTETAVYESEEAEGFELYVTEPHQGIFPSVPLHLKSIGGV